MTIGKSISIKNGFASSSPQGPSTAAEEIKKFSLLNKIEKFNNSFYKLEIPDGYLPSNKIDQYVSNNDLLTLEKTTDGYEYINKKIAGHGSLITDRFSGYFVIRIQNRNQTIGVLNFQRSYFNNYILNNNSLKEINNLEELGIPDGFRPTIVIDNPSLLTHEKNFGIFLIGKHYFVYFNQEDYNLKKGPDIGIEGETILDMLDYGDKIFTILCKEDDTKHRVLLLNKDENYSPTGVEYTADTQYAISNFSTDGKKVIGIRSYDSTVVEFNDTRMTEISDKFAKFTNLGYPRSTCYIKDLDVFLVSFKDKNDYNSYINVYFDSNYENIIALNNVFSSNRELTLKNDNGNIFFTNEKDYYDNNTTVYANHTTFNRKLSSKYNTTIFNTVDLHTASGQVSSFENRNASIYGAFDGNDPFDSLKSFKSLRNINELKIYLEDRLDNTFYIRHEDIAVNKVTIENRTSDHHSSMITNLSFLDTINVINCSNLKIKTQSSIAIDYNTCSLLYNSCKFSPTENFYGDNGFMSFYNPLTRKITFNYCTFEFDDKEKSNNKYALFFRDIDEINFINVTFKNLKTAIKFDKCKNVNFYSYTLDNVDKLFNAENSIINIMKTDPVSYDKTNCLINQVTA